MILKIKAIIPLFLIYTLILPLGIKIIHSFESHVGVKHCNDLSTHIHERDQHLDLLDYALLSAVEYDQLPLELKNFVLIKTPKQFYTFRPNRKTNLGIVTRGPPIT